MRTECNRYRDYMTIGHNTIAMYPTTKKLRKKYLIKYIMHVMKRGVS